MNDEPQVIVMAGPNGAGKSTASLRMLPSGITYVNADEVAKALPGYPSREADLWAGRIVLESMDNLADRREDFAVETTLAGLSLAARVDRLRKTGYFFRLIYLWTPNAEFSIKRVAARVRAGGHHIPEDVIRRRYTAGLVNFFGRYRPIADSWEVYDNTKPPDPLLVAAGVLHGVDVIEDIDIWTRMRRGGGDGS